MKSSKRRGDKELPDYSPEALRLAVAGRRPELLREPKMFDLDRILERPLFAAVDDRQQKLFKGGAL